eukprot:TRINITY_DN822_c0_g1_i4.p2 TRINITY_DN822_c0_g1~~TRINITY_DN822_c0_g1_i4.p2  ORF type:complete len:131 (+),score=36.86 TRINITY_DN822_c0_g1_i4:342-734(+)
MAIYEKAEWMLLDVLGMGTDYYKAGGGVFNLTQHIDYLKEVRKGDTVAVHYRLLGRSTSKKRLRFVFVMVNTSAGVVASTLQCLCTHISLATRRSSAFPDRILATIEEHLAQHKALPFAEPPSVLCMDPN